MNTKEIVQSVFNKIKDIEDIGNVATYIPELENVDVNSFGVHISTLDNVNFGVGNCNDRFSIQSIVKVLSVTMAYDMVGEKLGSTGLPV